MNKILSVFLFTILTPLCVYAQQQDPVALTINRKPVLRSEIEYAYKKANEQKVIGEKESFNDFLQSYIILKLNVEEAKAQHLDTTANFKRELSSARVQTSYKYMEDTEYEDIYVRKIYDRMLENVEINHVLLPFEKEQVFPFDTLTLYKQALVLREKLLQSGFTGENYKKKGTPAKEIIPDYNSINGYVGWITPFIFPSKVEDAAYNLPIGEISLPIRTQRGYHIIQVLNRRPAIGSVELEQVVFGFTHIPPPQNQIDSVAKVAWREYNNIKSDADFQSLCEEFAQAMQTGDRGCYLGVVGLESTMPPSFVSAAFDLEKKGDISKPVLTDYGYHIIRLLNKIPVAEYSRIKESLRTKVLSSDKAMNLSKTKRQQIASNVQLNINQKTYRELSEIANTISPQDSAFFNKIKNGKEILFSIDGKVDYTVNDFVGYLRFRQSQLKKEMGDEPEIMQLVETVKYNLSTDQLKEYYESYSSREASNYYYSTLEERYPEFKRLMNEFSDGLLLFAVKDKNVWKRSTTDEKGLSEYFNKNRSKYKLDAPKYKGMIVFAKDEKSLTEAEALARKEKDIDKLIQKIRSTLNKNTVVIQMEPGSWEKGGNRYVDNKIYGGAAPAPRRDFPYFFVTGQFIDAPRDYIDVRNAVENDYQDLLEKEWDTYLKNKYKVEIEKLVLDTIQ